MTKFAYTALRSDGEAVNGTLEAETPGLARVLLAEQELRSIELQEKRSIMQLELTRKKVARRDLMHFSRQMAVFIRAGIPILDALDVIAEETGDRNFRMALERIGDALRQGETFSGAAAAETHVFPPFYMSVLRSAELTGTLDIVLDQLAEYIERDLDARRKVTSALTYPAVVALMSVVTALVLTVWVLPRFRVLFDSLNAELPLTTRSLLALSGFIGRWFPVIIGVMVLAVVSVIGALHTAQGQAARDRLVLRIPVVGDMVRHAILERFCRILSSMMRAGVPLPEAMAVTSDATSNAVYRRGLDAARESMLRGEGLAAPLAATGLFPPSAMQMMRVGENTGSLDAQLETAAIYFERELDYRIKRFTALFEPAVIVMMAVVVGFVAVSLVQAMYGIFQTTGKL